jgi:hypothetical protein
MSGVCGQRGRRECRASSSSAAPILVTLKRVREFYRQRYGSWRKERENAEQGGAKGEKKERLSSCIDRMAPKETAIRSRDRVARLLHPGACRLAGATGGRQRLQNRTLKNACAHCGTGACGNANTCLAHLEAKKGVRFWRGPAASRRNWQWVNARSTRIAR